MKAFRKIAGAVFVGVAFGLLIFSGFVYLLDTDFAILKQVQDDIGGVRDDDVGVRNGIGIKIYTVLSGSMEPRIKTGSVIISKASPIYSAGDIITFAPNGRMDRLVTHRIVGVSPSESERGAGFFTQGDANEEPDPWVVEESQILGAATHSIPYVGYFSNFVKTPQGFVAFIIIPATVIVWEEIKILFSEVKRGFGKFKRIAIPHQVRVDPTEARGFEIKPLVVIPLVGLVGLLTAFTGAFFFDFENTTGNVLAVYTPGPERTPHPTGPPQPTTPPTASGEIVINEINWVGSNGDGLDEWVELYNTTESPIDLTGWVVENLGTGNGPNRDVTIESGLIPANGYFLISNSDSEDSRINVEPDLVSSNVSLVNGGEQLILKKPDSSVVDIANGTGSWFAGNNSTPKKTMERIDPGVAGTDSSNWEDAKTHTGMDSSGVTDEFGTPKHENGL